MAMGRSTTRFTYYCLEEGEEYLDMAIAEYFPPSSAPLAARRRQHGRFRLCTNSVFFEPDEAAFPICKFAFRNFKSRRVLPCDPGVAEGIPSAFEFECPDVVHMLAHNVVNPHEHVQCAGLHVFSLVYARLDDYLPQVNNLLCLARIDAANRQSALTHTAQERESRYTFDYSWLHDVKEQEKYKQHTAYRVFPLVRVRGRVLATNMAVYFASFNPIDACPVSRCLYTDVRYVNKRQYMLRDLALEVVTKDEDYFLIAFDAGKEAERDALYDTLCEWIPQLHTMGNLTDMTHRWLAGEVSNFDYLMYLNWRSGRSFNDLSQYPVFPWILQDYTSPTLDLSQPGIYRDLQKPVGALDAGRLENFKSRMADVQRVAQEEEEHERRQAAALEKKRNKRSFLSRMKPGSAADVVLTPAASPVSSSSTLSDHNQTPFLYGTHYSAPGYVLFYLVREVPDWMILLHQGKFDAPDRLFDSIPDCWSSVTGKSAADVKELLPQFFCGDGTFLTNTLHPQLGLGTKQSGTKVRDRVELPPWADNDPQQFIRINRMALEGEYVSQRLHHWVDLIFGYAQRGEAAVEHDNLFHPLTYSDNIPDLDAIADETQRSALEIQIREFGQTPAQLFSKPHPKRTAKCTPPDRISFTSFMPPDGDMDGAPERKLSNPMAPRRTHHVPVPASPTTVTPTVTVPSEAAPVSPGDPIRVPKRTHRAERTTRRVSPPTSPLEPAARMPSTGSAVLDMALSGPLEQRPLSPKRRDRKRHVADSTREGTTTSGGVTGGRGSDTGSVSNDSWSSINDSFRSGVGVMDDVSLSSLPTPLEGEEDPPPFGMGADDDNDDDSPTQQHRETPLGGFSDDLLSPEAPSEDVAGVWTLKTCSKLHKDAITCCAVSQMGHDVNTAWLESTTDRDSIIVYTSSADTTAKIFNAGAGRQIRNFKGIGSGAVSSFAVTSTQGSPLMILGSWDNHLYIAQPEYGRVLDSVGAHEASVSSVALTTCDTLVCTGSWDCTVKVWQLGSSGLRSTPIATYDHDDELRTVAISPMNKLCAALSADGVIGLYDVRQDTAVVQTLRDTGVVGEALCWLDEAHYATTSTTGVQIRHIGYPSPITEVETVRPWSLAAVSRKTFAVGTSGGGVSVHSTAEGKAGITLETTPDFDEVQALAARQGHLVAGDVNGRVAVWQWKQDE